MRPAEVVDLRCQCILGMLSHGSCAGTCVYLHQCKGLLGESGMGVRGEQGPFCAAHPLPEVSILKLILDTSTDKPESPDCLSVLSVMRAASAEQPCCLAAVAALAADWLLGKEALKALGCS